MAARDQPFDTENQAPKRDIAYYAHAFAADAVDLTITNVPDDGRRNSHAKVELVFFQDKGNHKREVVTAVHMQLYELQRMSAQIEQKILAFLGKST